MRESIIRFGIFFAFFLLFSILETLYPRRDRVHSRALRWPNNLGILVIGSLLGRVIPFFIPYSAALRAERMNFGLFHRLPVPGWAAFIFSILLLDLLIYWQHRLFHTVPLLSKIHRMHHTDRDFDTSTALRFHPIEIVFSMVLKTAAVWLLGAPAEAVMVFEILLNGTAMFNHTNMLIPAGTDRKIRTILVTPDMHRIHHSVLKNERNSNYGFALSWWDHIFRSYTDKPEAGYDGMELGVPGYDDRRHQRLDWMLAVPFFPHTDASEQR